MLNISNPITNDWAIFLGHLIGDGSISDAGLISYVTKNNRNQLQRYISAFDACLPFSPFLTLEKTPNSYVYRVRRGSKISCNEITSRFGNLKSSKWKIPKDLYGNKELFLNFLTSYIIDDGHLASKNKIQLISVNPNLKKIEQLITDYTLKNITATFLGPYENISCKSGVYYRLDIKRKNDSQTILDYLYNNNLVAPDTNNYITSLLLRFTNGEIGRELIPDQYLPW